SLAPLYCRRAAASSPKSSSSPSAAGAEVPFRRCRILPSVAAGAPPPRSLARSGLLPTRRRILAGAEVPFCRRRILPSAAASAEGGPFRRRRRRSQCLPLPPPRPPASVPSGSRSFGGVVWSPSCRHRSRLAVAPPQMPLDLASHHSHVIFSPTGLPLAACTSSVG
ncbi:hypothetical protein EE612_053680, partial [Oryza sativa]